MASRAADTSARSAGRAGGGRRGNGDHLGQCAGQQRKQAFGGGVVDVTRVGGRYEAAVGQVTPDALRRKRPLRTSTMRWSVLVSGADQPVWSSWQVTDHARNAGRSAMATDRSTSRR
ncbi:MAG TPA: hypothetical protein VH333_11045 [Pseudonocardiaceae bacterium]|jgi:hypothetical protein|nr:hypothetical protein [Pseudonocardiaceae bacterium]